MYPRVPASTNFSVPLKQQLLESCPWLFEELGFAVVYQDYSIKSFGDSLVILRSPSLRVQFVRDRGQVLGYLASAADPENWWPVVFVLEAIQDKLPEPNFELLAVASELRNNLPALIEAMGPKYTETKSELERRAGERLRRLQKPRTGR
jgi:hypothetical protein